MDETKEELTIAYYGMFLSFNVLSRAVLVSFEVEVEVSKNHSALDRKRLSEKCGQIKSVKIN